MPSQHIQIIAPGQPDFPANIRHLSDPPARLYVRSDSWPTLMELPSVAIVGSRKVTAYGKRVTHEIAGKLARAGVVVVSGLAYGVDSIAHRAALEAGGRTVAVLPCDIQTVYPRSHTALAEQIINRGGAVLSEYGPDSPTYRSNFIARNRLVAALAAAVLVTEASDKSGTLHTARFALDLGKDVLAVPGDITSPNSAGTNNLIKSGATPVTGVDDILHALGLEPSIQPPKASSNDPRQQSMLDLLAKGVCDNASLLHKSQLDVKTYSQTMTMLELSGHIRPLGNNYWGLL